MLWVQFCVWRESNNFEVAYVLEKVLDAMSMSLCEHVPLIPFYVFLGFVTFS